MIEAFIGAFIGAMIGFSLGGGFGFILCAIIVASDDKEGKRYEKN